jgi:hypothetical protein
MDNVRITIRHRRKREFFSKLALAGETAQNVLSTAIDNYLMEKKTMTREDAYKEAEKKNIDCPFKNLFIPSLIGDIRNGKWAVLKRDLSYEEKSKVMAGILPDPETL